MNEKLTIGRCRKMSFVYKILLCRFFRNRTFMRTKMKIFTILGTNLLLNFKKLTSFPLNDSSFIIIFKVYVQGMNSINVKYKRDKSTRMLIDWSSKDM